MYSHLEEYINYGNLNSVKWSMADEIKNSEDFRKSNAENFYIRTEKPNQLTHEIKEIKVSGLIDKDFNLDTDYFFQNSKDQGMVMMECAGNDRLARFRLMSAAQWSGVPLEELITKDKNGFSFFGLTRVDNEATHVHVEGFDETTNTNWKKLFGVRSKPGASWIFTIDELIKQKAFIATHMNGEKLTGDHGHPIRLVVPGFYGCASIKWLTNIAFFKATNKTPTESQMREFSDRTGQTGVPKLYNNLRSPIIELSAMMITVEKWKTLESKIRYRFIGVMWGAVDEANHQLTIEIRKKNKKNKLIQVGNVQALPRDNTRSFHTWSYWWDEPEKGYFTVDLVSANAKISTRRLDNKHYRRVVCIKAV
ncbi:MAG: DMSO/TMAO reductase YedYZ molybdopterin-dependent catalytic subunit [Thermoproteota archaeon]|jgi:DMSO/TMAO reductase YedYZ molybdopterin-dependent catalytic subunit